MELDTTIASLEKGYNQLMAGSFHTSAEITAERRGNTELRRSWFYTANIGLYRQTEQGLQYGIGGREAFDAIAGGANIGKFCGHLRDNHNYPLTPEQTEQLASLDDIAWVNPEALPLEEFDGEFSYVEVSTGILEQGREAFKREYGEEATKLFDCVHGEAIYGSNGIGAELKQEGKNTTRIYVLNPKYVKQQTGQGQAIARACWLGNFGNHSYFSAGSRSVDGNYGLRGVRREQVREADAPQKLVSLEEGRLHNVLANYLGPAVLPLAKIDVAKLYR